MITVPSSERLEALIDESKRLLESKHVNEEVRPEDKIRRIVLHQATTNIHNTVKTETIQLKDGKVQ
jgi:ribosomal protein L4